jgi:hypothetical protein
VPFDVSELPSLTINLEHGDTDDEACCLPPLQLFEQFTVPNPQYPGYGALEANLSVLVVPDDIDAAWWKSPDSYWMRQKVRRAIKLGYTFGPLDFNNHLDDIYEINTSKSERQGRAMTESYLARPQPERPGPELLCDRHRPAKFGVFLEGKLVAYTFINHSGEMISFSTILGHGDHMDDGIMNLLVFEVVKWYQERSRIRYAMYFLNDSGTAGLQFFKRKMGFAGYNVRWELSRRIPVAV